MYFAGRFPRRLAILHPMPFDSVTTTAVAEDLRAHLLGGRVDKIIQSAPLEVALLLRAEYANQWIVLSAHPQQARVQRTLTKQAPASASPVPL